MKKKQIWIVLIFAAIISIAVYSIAEQDINTKNSNKQETIINMGWFRMYFVPFIPVISVAIVVLGGAWINYCYWKKKESITKNYKIFEERIRSFLDFCRNLAEFNACTDLILRADKRIGEINNDKSKENYEGEINELQKNISNYQLKQIDAVSGLSEKISYARIFFETNEVDEKIKEYIQSYENIRTGATPWDRSGNAFNDLLNSGRNVKISMENELKEKVKEAIDMKKRKCWILLLVISVFLSGIALFPKFQAHAANGQPPCCLYLKGAYPTTVVNAIKPIGARPVDFKIFATVKKITSKKPYQIDLNVLSFINKKKIIDLQMKAAIMKFDIPNKLIWLTEQIREGDYIILIPTQAYNTQLDKRMYDFIKIPIEMIKKAK
jgi:hypothetical protein